MSHYSEVYDFWFHKLTPKEHFKKSEELDLEIKNRFYSLLKKAANHELTLWRNSAKGSLSEIILLDQFSRNIFRGKPQAFENDNLALKLSQEAIKKSFDRELSSLERSFLYMPFMHSESKDIHIQAIKLFSQSGLEENLRFELRHKEIIDRFGRYPHRNEILNRKSTPEEIDFLKQPGSSF